MGDLKWTIFVTQGVMKSQQHEMEFFTITSKSDKLLGHILWR